MEDSPFAALPPSLAAALAGRGFTELTPVQAAVLDPELSGRDLRISSKTGSGKTVALGLVIAREMEVDAPEEDDGPGARPRALVVAPTRELATQVARELAWLLEAVGATVTAVTGGTSVREERRELSSGATVVVGTPGRLRDHLGSGAIDAARVRTVVLDEADQMLDLGFREDLEAILGATPAGRRTHLVSATFSRAVIGLADEVQADAYRIDATAPGQANDDIAHVAHLVRPDERNAALVNLLLLAPEERTLVFVRTRADAANVADGLASIGFGARPLSGEMEQDERTRTLDAFRNGSIRILVATDVAARGLDVAEVTRVIHADPPGDAEALTHRSGRTGRAGKKGTAIVLVPPGLREVVQRLYGRARIRPTWAPVPTAADVDRATEERLALELATDPKEPDERFFALADRLAELRDARVLVAALLARLVAMSPRPREVTPVAPPAAAPPRPDRLPLPPPARARQGGGPAPTAWVPFRITWGTQHGADPRRLLAVVCRRGNIAGFQVGSIRMGELWSTFQIADDVADAFASAAAAPDPRDPRVRIERWLPPGERPAKRPRPGAEARPAPASGDEPPPTHREYVPQAPPTRREPAPQRRAHGDEARPAPAHREHAPRRAYGGDEARPAPAHREHAPRRAHGDEARPAPAHREHAPTPRGPKRIVRPGGARPAFPPDEQPTRVERASAPPPRPGAHPPKPKAPKKGYPKRRP